MGGEGAEDGALEGAGEGKASGGVDVVNPCFTPAAQYGRVTVQPVSNLIYLRCSSFLHHWPSLTWTYTGRTVNIHCVSVMVFSYSGEAEHRWGQTADFTQNTALFLHLGKIHILHLSTITNKNI